MRKRYIHKEIEQMTGEGRERKKKTERKEEREREKGKEEERGKERKVEFGRPQRE